MAGLDLSRGSAASQVGCGFARGGRLRRLAALGLTGTAIGLLAGPAFAQEQKQDEGVSVQQETLISDPSMATLLDRITVVSRTAETPIETLGSVSQVSGEALERRMATTQQDVFFGVPGVTIQQDSRRIASGINIRGLQDYGRVAVIVDGARQNFQRSDHGTQSMFFLDPELIEQVDVVRGPVANTYGSGAIGGVVYFETKDAGDFLRPGESWAASVTPAYETNGEGWTTSATGAVRFSEAADIIANIVWRDYGAYDDGHGDRVTGTGFDVLSGLAKATFRPTDTSELKLGWIGADNGWSEFSGSSGEQKFDQRQNSFTARYHVTDPDRTWLDLHVNASINNTRLDQTYLNDVQQFDRDTGLPVTIPAGSGSSYDLMTYGLDIWNTSRFDTGPVSHELTYGGDFVLDDVDNTGPTGGDEVYTPSGERRIWGAYVQDRLTYDWLEIIGGLRYDNYSLESDVAENSGSRLSPRITVGVSPFKSDALDGLQFYGTYAEGYRSPSVSETLISGLHPSGVTFPFLPNPDLQPETGRTVEFGLNYKQDGILQPDDRLRLKAAWFHNDVDNFIDLNSSIPVGTPGCPFLPGIPFPDPDTGAGGYIPICAQYQNFDEARIHGVELEATYDGGRYFAGLSASFADGYRVAGGVREDLYSVPAAQVTGSLGFRFLENRLTVGGEVQYNEPPSGAAFADDYTLVNLFASYQATENARFDLRVDNLFDVNYENVLNAGTTERVFEPGISVKLAAKIRFGG